MRNKLQEERAVSPEWRKARIRREKSTPRGESRWSGVEKSRNEARKVNSKRREQVIRSGEK